ncbi:hypothetical protein BV898_13143 [Hypsibius exemplaris]|uniref:BZIP domain-containing protein n=1 Tax=Hypsibius exemplaris TaxID=2072580 RepID=A0A1W0WBI9_HYPEX|nr:hypothetical protein BV898_13143 [Hypsibius exemplaris]
MHNNVNGSTNNNSSDHLYPHHLLQQHHHRHPQLQYPYPASQRSPCTLCDPATSSAITAANYLRHSPFFFATAATDPATYPIPTAFQQLKNNTNDTLSSPSSIPAVFPYGSATMANPNPEVFVYPNGAATSYVPMASSFTVPNTATEYPVFASGTTTTLQPVSNMATSAAPSRPSDHLWNCTPRSSPEYAVHDRTDNSSYQNGSRRSSGQMSVDKDDGEDPNPEMPVFYEVEDDGTPEQQQPTVTSSRAKPATTLHRKGRQRSAGPLSSHAVYARLNRERRKQYIVQLEQYRSTMRKRQVSAREALARIREESQRLTEEIAGLRRDLQQNGALMKLLTEDQKQEEKHSEQPSNGDVEPMAE